MPNAVFLGTPQRPFNATRKFRSYTPLLTDFPLKWAFSPTARVGSLRRAGRRVHMLECIEAAIEGEKWPITFYMFQIDKRCRRKIHYDNERGPQMSRNRRESANQIERCPTVSQNIDSTQHYPKGSASILFNTFPASLVSQLHERPPGM